MSERGWVSVTRREPCAICNHDSWCTRSADGAVTLCRRTGGEGAVERTDRVGAAFWIHVSQNEPHRRSVRPLPPPPASESNLAHPEQLGAVYSALLRELSLSQEHRDNLRTRALSDRLIIQAGYRSMPLRGRSAVAGRIVGTFGEDTCAGVPGLYLAEGDLGRKFWTLGGSPGLIIPVRDIQGRVIAMQIRRREAGGYGKYQTLSSRRHGGPSPGTPCHVSLEGAGDTVRVTEGPLKADIAAALSGVRTIGVLGVGTWRLALPVLEALGAKTILIAFDQDWRTNQGVAEALTSLTLELLRAKYRRIWIEDWYHTPQNKGIDDLLAAGFTPKLRPASVAIGAASRAKFQPQRRSCRVPTISAKEVPKWHA